MQIIKTKSVYRFLSSGTLDSKKQLTLSVFIDCIKDKDNIWSKWKSDINLYKQIESFSCIKAVKMGNGGGGGGEDG